MWNMNIWKRVSICPVCLLGCSNKVPQVAFLKQQKFIFSQFWRLADCNRGVDKVGSLEGCEGELALCLSPSVWWFTGTFWHSLTSKWITLIFAFMCTLSSPYVCLCLCPDFPLLQGHQSSWIRPNPMTSFSLDYFCKDPSPNKLTFQSPRG